RRLEKSHKTETKKPHRAGQIRLRQPPGLGTGWELIRPRRWGFATSWRGASHAPAFPHPGLQVNCRTVVGAHRLRPRREDDTFFHSCTEFVSFFHCGGCSSFNPTTRTPLIRYLPNSLLMSATLLSGAKMCV